MSSINRLLSIYAHIAFLACLISIQAAAAPELFLAHGTIKQKNNSYRITGQDPYFVTQLEINEATVSANTLSLNISIKRPTDHHEALPAELFFKVIRMDSVPIFDPLYKLQFQLPDTNFSKIAISLPKNIKLRAGQLLRLDIDACLKCIVSIQTNFLIGTPQAKPNVAQIEIANYLNGVQNLPKQGKYISAFTKYQDWRLHDFDRNQNMLLISNTDPFLVSPPLYISTQNFSGMLLDMRVPSFNPPIYDFQVFYSTEEHRFIEQASSVIRVLGKSAREGDHNRLRFFVPLDFLSKQFPPVKVIKRVRLDLVRYPSDRVDSDTWSLPKVKLVHKSESINPDELSTTRIVHAKKQHAAFDAVIAEIFKNLGNDLGFLAGYAVMILLLIVVAVRRFRASAI